MASYTARSTVVDVEREWSVDVTRPALVAGEDLFVNCPWLLSLQAPVISMASNDVTSARTIPVTERHTLMASDYAVTLDAGVRVQTDTVCPTTHPNQKL